ncbi:MAG: phosphoribosyltransferase family protein [Bacteroidota bacterium]
MQNLIHQLKYKNQKELGIFLGQWYGAELNRSPVIAQPDFVVPVPMHPRKQRKRGYNQAELFAAGLAETMKSTLDITTLTKTTATESQTRKGRLSRWENVKEVFSLSDARHFENKNIMLVDDVITTGATLEACGQMLLKVPGAKISIAAIATAGIC